ncbi:hypothetical protein HMPREF2851_03865 [Actinomyces sp. HMSC064C12]|nr:hypothetical protein HMPREF2851_03865 [Actinomyces sp. HMSC064C12]
MGPSGSGKTTLLNLLDGSLGPEKGTVKIAGRPVSDFPLKDLRGKVLARVFQDYRLIPYLSARDNIRLAQQVAGTLGHNPDTASRLLQRLGLGDIADSRADQLSGGEAQRVAIARALANKPKVILADEPTGALDEESSSGISELLGELAHELDVCIVTVTHDPAVAKAADRVLEVSEHKLIEKR